MTASLGVGKAYSDADARDYIIGLCANLDAKNLSTVERYKDELKQHVNVPKRGRFNVSKLEVYNSLSGYVSACWKCTERTCPTHHSLMRLDTLRASSVFTRETTFVISCLFLYTINSKYMIFTTIKSLQYRLKAAISFEWFHKDKEN